MKRSNNTRRTILYFPPQYIELMKELDNPEHAGLKATLRLIHAKYPGNHNLGTYLSEIALHCNVIVEALLTEEDQLRLMTLLTERLRQKRAIVITSSIH